MRRGEAAHGKAKGGEVVRVGDEAALVGLDSAMDFKMEKCVEPIAPKLSGAAEEANGMGGMRGEWAAVKLLLDDEGNLSAAECAGKTVVVLDKAEK